MISTVFGCENVDSGRKDWKTKEIISKPDIIIKYNKLMGGVDANDQLLQYSEFSRRSTKWWKKVFFRIINLCMINAYILYNEHNKNKNKGKSTQQDFRLGIIKQLLGETVGKRNTQYYVAPNNDEASRLTGRQFPAKWVSEDGKSKPRACKVCVPAERKLQEGKPKKQRYGCENCINVNNVMLACAPSFVSNYITQERILLHVTVN